MLGTEEIEKKDIFSVIIELIVAEREQSNIPWVFPLHNTIVPT